MKTYIIIGACLVLAALGFVTGHALWPKHSTTTITETVVKHDTLTVRQIVYKHGSVIVRTDTIKYADSTEVNGLYSLIEALSNQPVPEQGAAPAPAQAAKAWALGPAIGCTYNFKSARVAPHLGLMLEKNKTGILALGGYDSGWTATLLLRRKF